MTQSKDTFRVVTPNGLSASGFTSPPTLEHKDWAEGTRIERVNGSGEIVGVVHVVE